MLQGFSALVSFATTSVKAIVNIPTMKPTAKIKTPTVAKSGETFKTARASIPVRKPAMKRPNPNTKKPPKKPFSKSILYSLNSLHAIPASFKKKLF